MRPNYGWRRWLIRDHQSLGIDYDGLRVASSSSDLSWALITHNEAQLIPCFTHTLSEHRFCAYLKWKGQPNHQVSDISSPFYGQSTVTLIDVPRLIRVPWPRKLGVNFHGDNIPRIGIGQVLRALTVYNRLNVCSPDLGMERIGDSESVPLVLQCETMNDAVSCV